MTPRRLGIIDWGIGGLDVFAKLRGVGMLAPVLYVSDAGAVPYGKQSDDALAARVATLVRALVRRGCDQVVIGCNAASTVLEHPLLRRASVPITGVIAPGIAATLEAGVSSVAVLGGRRTVESGLYGAALRPAGVEVHEVVAQPLSALVERGRLRGPEVQATVERVVAPVRDTTAIVSACTHYVALLPVLRAALPRLRTVIDPAEALAARQFRVCPASSTPDVFWTTGDPDASTEAARLAFGLQVRFESAAGQLPAP